ncbi:MAG: pirin family protein [Pseudomonadota bacterium]
MQRSIDSVLPAEQVIDDGDMVLWRALPLPARTSLGPFIFIDHYRHHSRRGIGDKPHPHAGIEVLSYLLEGGVEHRDSLGNVDRLGPGDAQCIHAGRGILHAEQPAGGRHGLQLWTKLPSALQLSAPTYASFRAADIPEVGGDGVATRVVAGQVTRVQGPMRLASPTVFAHVRLAAGATAVLDVDADVELGLYVLQGRLQNAAGPPLGTGALALLSPGGQVCITATGDAGADVALLGGQATVGPVLFSGPFVMDTPERLAQARRDFASGAMGTLDGVPF